MNFPLRKTALALALSAASFAAAAQVVVNDGLDGNWFAPDAGGRGVSIEVDAYKDRKFGGVVTAVNPAIDPTSRSAIAWPKPRRRRWLGWMTSTDCRALRCWPPVPWAVPT